MKKSRIVLIISLAIPYVAFTQNKYSSWNEFKYSGPGLKQIGWMDTKHSKEIISSSWSVGCETLDRDYADFSIYKNYVGELGIKWGRLQSGWAKCEKEKGKYNFAWLDNCIYGLAEQSVQPWVCLCYGNPLYNSDIRLGAKIFTDDKTMNAWLRYVEATVKRYKDVVKMWEVWNEPYGQEKEYAPLLIKTAELIKKIQPEAIIQGETLWNVEEDIDNIKTLFDILKAGDKLELIDFWAYHPYLKNPDDCYPILDKFIAFLKSYNSNYKLYQGENGCPSQLEWTHALNGYPWTEISQAKWLMRRMAGDHVRNIPTSVFTIIDLQYYNMLQSFGLIRSNAQHEIIYKRPSYYGVQHMVSFFDDSVQAIGELEYESNAYRKITVAGFRKEESPVALIWYKDQIPGDDFKWDLINLTVKNTNFKNPVYVEMISGKVYEIDSSDWENNGQDTNFKNLPIWDSVIMITERSNISLNQ